MVLFPGCRCCEEVCKPCSYCTSARCLKVNFSKFKQLPNTFSDCDHCRYLDDTTVVVRTARDENPEITLTVSDPFGTGAELAHTLTKNSDNSLSVASISVTKGGSGYEDPSLSIAAVDRGTYPFQYASAIVCKAPRVNFDISGAAGAIASVTLIDGGEIWPGSAPSLSMSPCGYDGTVCGGCPADVGLRGAGTRSSTIALLTFGIDSHGITVSGGGSTVQSTAVARDDEGNQLSCNSATFKASDTTGCHSNGTITVEQADCEDESVSPCPMPDQISMRVQWPGYTITRDEFANSIFESFCWTAVYGDLERQPYDKTTILDRVTSFWSGSGYVEVPCSTFYEDQESGNIVNFRPFGNIVTAEVEPPPAPPSWYINQPERRTATAEVTGINGDQLTTIVVTDGGAGYEYEIQQRVEPHLTLTADTSGGGSGATFSVTMEQIGSGDDAVWGIASVEVTNGGQDYPENGAVGIAVAEGETIVEQATLTFRAVNGVITSVSKDAQQARRPASVLVYGTNGSGANFVATQTRANAYVNNVLQSGWAISGVTLAGNVGGGNYQDGELAVFEYSQAATVGCQPKGRIDTVQEKPVLAGIQFLDAAWYAAFGEQPPTGTGAAFTASTLSLVTKAPRTGIDAWYVFGSDYNWRCAPTRERWGLDISNGTDVSSVIVSGGSGYQVGTLLRFTFANTGYSSYDDLWDNYTINELPYLRISAVDSNGAITGVEIPDTGGAFAGGAGRFARDTGVARGVTINPDCFYQTVYEPSDCRTGLAYIEDGTVATGKYFAVAPTGQTYTSAPAVTIRAAIGSGAQAEAEVSNGAVSSINITNPGSGYSPQRIVWIVDIFDSDHQGNFYMCAGSQYTGASCACATPMSGRLSDRCPGDLFGEYDLGSRWGPTFDKFEGPTVCGFDDVPGGYCAYWLSLYGWKPPKTYFMTGGKITITPVDP